MKDYIKPEVEIINFATEPVLGAVFYDVNQGDESGEDMGGL